MVSEPAHKERKIWSTLLGIDQEQLNPILNKYWEACNTGTISSYQFWEDIHEELGIPIKYDAETMFLKTLEEVQPYEEMFDLIKRLKWLWYTCTVLSDIFPTDKKYVQDQWWYDVFDDLILSCDVWLSKSQDKNNHSQQIFEYALQKYHQDASECVFIDDRKSNCESAERAGIQSILATSPQQVIQDLNWLLNS